MEFEKLKFTLEEVDRAGEDLKSPKDKDTNWFEVLNNFRAAHNWPLSVITEELRACVRLVDQNAIISSRLKRFPAIQTKLWLKAERKVTLSNMQDIGGCRAVLESVNNIGQVISLVKSSVKHKLVKENDYVLGPKKETGYRSHHLVYQFSVLEPDNLCYEGMFTEVQVRSRLQHAWAAAVETVDRFKKFSLKVGFGEYDWNRFFKLMATVIALKEQRRVVSDTPSNPLELRAELIQLAERLDIVRCLKAYSTAIEKDLGGATSQGNFCYVLTVWPESGESSLIPFKASEIKRAMEVYSEQEKKNRESKTGGDTVLAFADDIEQLREAYPSYYGDTETFQAILREWLE